MQEDNTTKKWHSDNPAVCRYNTPGFLKECVVRVQAEKNVASTDSYNLH